MNNNDYVPINPQITFASGNAQLTENVQEVRLAIETSYPNLEAENKEAKQDDTKISFVPQIFFQGFSS